MTTTTGAGTGPTDPGDAAGPTGPVGERTAEGRAERAGPRGRHAPAGPAGPSQRLALLDVVRGVAILGTLMTNVWIFTAPGGEWGVLSGSGGAPGFASGSVGDAAETVFRAVADGKFLSLLTILFGAGIALQYAAAERRGLPWPGRYRWRALFLFAEGTVHFVLVFAWDVLMGYAVTALYVAWLLSRSERARRRAMWWAGGLHLALMLLLTAALALGGPAAGAGGVPQRVVDLYAHGSWPDQIAFRLENAVVLRAEPVLTFGLLVFLFLLGVRLLRAGAFGADAAGRRLRARMLAWGLGLGVPLNAACVLAGEAGFLPGRYVAAPLVAVGYAGLIGLLVDRVRRPGLLMGACISLGRAALSGYVLQNVLCVLVAYGVGLGLAARLGDAWRPWWVMGLWVAVSLVLLVGSSLWLRRFGSGPLEALQRRALRH
ncbi:DUF418 domain-containing protein [Streptomyces sp. CC77]|uniref:DUF418 domain-containing protein n=1 Tax=Streptomyces sp. CC77 TaxID=1906739 RepID=UPI0009A0D570|nr:DUF418 domain-containing protein [Streptomyces sp. CC77]